jgi:CO dehydrogenase/acetyl-CoA synthase delta subunit
VSPPTRRLNLPRPAPVRMGDGGHPVSVAGQPVDAVRESWLVEDRWWTGRPLRRRYWEVVTTTGRNLIVFHDLVTGGWFEQR